MDDFELLARLGIRGSRLVRVRWHDARMVMVGGIIAVVGWAIRSYTSPGGKPRAFAWVVVIVGAELMVIGTAWPSWWWAVIAAVIAPFLAAYAFTLAEHHSSRRR